MFKDYRRNMYVLGTTAVVELIVTFIIGIVVLIMGENIALYQNTRLIIAIILLSVMIETMTITIMRYNYNVSPIYKENLRRFSEGYETDVLPLETIDNSTSSDLLKYLASTAKFVAKRKNKNEVVIFVIYVSNRARIIERRIKMSMANFYKYFIFSDEYDELIG